MRRIAIYVFLLLAIPLAITRAQDAPAYDVVLRNGKIVEHWNNFDQLGMLQQLGAELKLAEQQTI